MKANGEWQKTERSMQRFACIPKYIYTRTNTNTGTNIDTNTQMWGDRSDEGKWRLARDRQEHKHRAMMRPWQIYRQIVLCKGLPGS